MSICSGRDFGSSHLLLVFSWGDGHFQKTQVEEETTCSDDDDDELDTLTAEPQTAARSRGAAAYGWR